jgi:hypothetical protein
MLPRTLKEIGIDARKPGEVQKLVKQVQAALKDAPVERRKSTVQFSAKLEVRPAALASVSLALREATLRTRDSNNLKELGLAFHNYHDAYGTLPGHAIYAKGKPLLSWRVALLPFLDHDLYKAFKLNEPWDSEHNKKLLSRIPRVYAPVRGKTKTPYSTYYQVFTGPDTPFNPATARPAGAGDAPRTAGARFADITDGLSNTILVVEAGEGVPWTKPEDLAYDARKPIPKLGGQFPDGFHVLLGDGSTTFLRKDFDEKTMRDLINPKDGNPVDFDKVRPRGARRR